MTDANIGVEAILASAERTSDDGGEPLLVLLPSNGTHYVCPGETQPISRSVHYARLAAFDPKCRDCPLRHDTGQLPRRTVDALAKAERRTPRTSLVGEDGLRGVYLNEITRPRAERIAERFSAGLWARRPLDVASKEAAPFANEAPRRSSRWRPRIVVGRDARRSSPEIAAGVVAALVRMGCEVVDVHAVARPVLWFAVRHLAADGALHVTGSGCPASWTGLDFVDERGLPIVDEATLAGLDAERRVPRPTRRSGVRRAFRAIVPYEAGLWRHFHALRPLKVVIACGSPLAGETLAQLFDRLPCRAEPITLPVRARNVRSTDDADVRSTAERLRATRADVGLIVDEDGQRTSVLDERGRLVEPLQLQRLLAAVAREEHPDAEVVPQVLPDAEAVFGRLRRAESGFATTLDGRSWFCEPTPTSDAILLLARLLTALSRTDAPFSDVLSSTGERAA